MKILVYFISIVLIFLSSCTKEGEVTPTGEPTVDTLVYLIDSVYASDQEHYDSLILVYVQEIYGESIDEQFDSLQAQIDSLELVLYEYQLYDNVIYYIDEDGRPHTITYNENGTVNTEVIEWTVLYSGTDFVETREYVYDGNTVYIYSETISSSGTEDIARHLYATYVYQ